MLPPNAWLSLLARLMSQLQEDSMTTYHYCFCCRTLGRPVTIPGASYKMRMQTNMKAMVWDDSLDAPNAGEACLIMPHSTGSVILSASSVIHLHAQSLTDMPSHLCACSFAHVHAAPIFHYVYAEASCTCKRTVMYLGSGLTKAASFSVTFV